jgi:hypothetical protein
MRIPESKIFRKQMRITTGTVFTIEGKVKVDVNGKSYDILSVDF